VGGGGVAMKLAEERDPLRSQAAELVRRQRILPGKEQVCWWQIPSREETRGGRVSAAGRRPDHRQVKTWRG